MKVACLVQEARREASPGHSLATPDSTSAFARRTLTESPLKSASDDVLLLAHTPAYVAGPVST